MQERTPPQPPTQITHSNPIKNPLSQHNPPPQTLFVQVLLDPPPFTFSCDYTTVCMFGRLPELLLLPGRRIHEYVTLLSWFELHTPSTHQDRADLADAIETLKVVNRHVQEVGIELSPLTQSCNGLVQEVGIELFPLTLFFKKKN